MTNDLSFFIFSFGTCSLYSGSTTLCNNFIGDSSYIYTLAECDEFKISGLQINLLRSIISSEESPECQDMVSRITLVVSTFQSPCVRRSVSVSGTAALICG